MQCIKRIEDPSNVAAIQKFFGITYNRRLPLATIPQNEYSKDEVLHMVPKTSNSTDPSETKTNGDTTNDKSTQNASLNVENGAVSDSDPVESNDYTIRYKCWYYFFISLTTLGDVIGYALVFPFLFWNVDGVIARKLVVIWTVIMYVGQAVKEIVCRGRPECPPVIRLQKRWSEEYGMPSTHAMASLALPAGLIYYLHQRYEFPLGLGIVISFVWCILISFSRLYLGMHSILDVIVGFLLSTVLLIFLLPGTDLIDESLVENDWSPLILLILSILLIAIYPKPKGPSTAHSRTDTTTILGTCVGIETGCWLNYKLGIVQKASELSYLLPDIKTIGFIALRTVLGLICIGISFVIFDLVSKFTYWVLRKINIPRDTSDSNKKIPIVDLIFSYLTFCITSVHVSFSIPFLFKLLNIHRPSYLAE